MLADTNFEKAAMSPMTNDSITGDNSTLEGGLFFDYEGEKESILSEVMNWFEENGIKPGNPEEIQT